MTAPTFDAHGWCHDMDAAPNDGQQVLLWASCASGGGWQRIGQFEADNLVWCGERGTIRPSAWRPLPLPPVGAE
jgi:hypothetical protein